jgi:predicted transcriptional regulator
LLYRIYVHSKIEGGERAIAEGRVVSHEEIERRIEEWARGD